MPVCCLNKHMGKDHQVVKVARERTRTRLPRPAAKIARYIFPLSLPFKEKKGPEGEFRYGITSYRSHKVNRFLCNH